MICANEQRYTLPDIDRLHLHSSWR